MGDTRPIGIFDSGVGGLTVLRQIHRIAPYESLVYLGDTARVPYGTKSKETVLRYSRNNIRFLDNLDVKMIVVACNTASAYALPQLSEEATKPVIGVVEGGATAASMVTKGAIGVIGTEATISSGAYKVAITRKAPGTKIFSKACPLFVPLAEEGWTDNDIARAVAVKYLGEMRGAIDTLVLGCTHYPPLKKVIGETVGENVNLIDSAEQTARIVVDTLREKDIERPEGNLRRGSVRLVVTDSPERTLAVAKRMLGDIELDRIELADIQKSTT